MTTIGITAAAAVTWTCRSSFCTSVLDGPSGHAHGFCSPCAQRWYRAGMPEDGPPPPRPGWSPPGSCEETRQRFAALREEGLTIAAAAAKLGLTPAAAGHYAHQLAARKRDEALEQALGQPIDWPVPTAPDPRATSWEGRAACRGQWGLFYAPDGRSDEHESLTGRLVREAKAKSLCAACPVRRECAQFAAGTAQRFGVWAGKSEDDREQEKRDQRNAKRRVAGRRQEDGELAAAS